jgi:DNA-directed RNA polymerase subunit beta
MANEQKFITSYKNYKAGVNDRLDFSKISGSLPLPNLVEIQTDSFKWFLEKGIDEVMKEVFPIANYANTVFIDYAGCHFEEPEHTPLYCREAELTYSSKLKVTLRLRFKATGEIKRITPFSWAISR